MRGAFLGFLVVLISACSEKQDQAAPVGTAEAGAETKACDVLTADAAAKALGRQVEKLDNQGGVAGQDICQYGYQGERLADMGNVSVTVQPVDLASVVEGAKAQGYALEPVEGLGDAAYYSADVGLYVGKGQRTAHYLLGAGGLADPKDKLIALAQDTVERL